MKRIIVRLAEGLGNQMFMYANAVHLSKKFNTQLIIDNKSAYFKKKNIRNFELDIFKLSSSFAPDEYLFNNYFKDFKRKFLKKIDKYKKYKTFFIENKNGKKETFYESINLKDYKDQIFVEGHFESENYFADSKDLLINEFTLKNNLIIEKTKYFDFLMKNNNNIVAIVLRQNRFSERTGNFNSEGSKQKSIDFVKEQINYFKRSTNYFKSKLNNPIFVVFSNKVDNLTNYFNANDYYLIDTSCENKTVLDFGLLKLFKHFIVGPTSFNWWPAWLNFKNQNETFIVRPKNINVSKNIDFWPKDWISI
tara:strand:+ start:856 stop:1776 length:921 start_codon:yes stop_codon:yes gene_type:complete